jgi:hypothetical protein
MQINVNSVVRAAIHPAIGIARVGDSPEEYFIGPELPDNHPVPEGGFKDSKGRLKRQAARFRIYGYNALNQVVGELTQDSPGIKIDWTAEVANTKSAWYNFEVAMDIPEAVPAHRRNPQFKEEERKKLKITPKPVEISGVKTQGDQYRFHGNFFDTQVYLGELRTDEAGRLLFLGGYGKSASFDGRPVYTFANNEGWHDDVSDGPVRAKVKINGKEIPVDSAWVVTAPPNYAPDIKGVVTLYDVMFEAAIAGGWKDVPKKPSFTKDILPIFQRLSRIQWVNYGIFVQFGWQGPQDLLNPVYLSKLASLDKQYEELRRQVYYSFRNPNFSDRQNLAWPWFYGDAMNVPPDSNRHWLALPPHLYTMLWSWATGNFEADWMPLDNPPQTLEAVPLSEQPETLDKAALDYCLGEAFHPGCEMTWPMRHPSIYCDAFRILHKSDAEPEVDYGDEIKPEQVFDRSNSSVYNAGVPGGPLFAQEPGDITRWMAVPWQTDTASCRNGYENKKDSRLDPYVPTFWPAHVPNEVLTEYQYQTAIDQSKPLEERKQAFNTRKQWLRPLPGNYFSQIRHMIADFGKLGVVEQKPGAKDDIDLPKVMFVESRAHVIKRRDEMFRDGIVMASEQVSEDELAKTSRSLEDETVDNSDLPFLDKARRRP